MHFVYQSVIIDVIELLLPIAGNCSYSMFTYLVLWIPHAFPHGGWSISWGGANLALCLETGGHTALPTPAAPW